MLIILLKNDSVGISFINFVLVIFHSKVNHDLVAQINLLISEGMQKGYHI